MKEELIILRSKITKFKGKIRKHGLRVLQKKVIYSLM